MTKTAKNSEFERTTVILPTGLLKDVKKVAKDKGMTQSGFIRFAIIGMIERFERGAIA